MIQGDGNIQVSRGRDRILITRTVGEVLPAQIAGPSADPYIGLGFYSYRSGLNVVISAGQLRVTLPASAGGTFSSVGGGIPQETITGLTPGESGFIVFRYGQSMGATAPTTTAREPDVDFGDPSGNYFVSETVGFDTSGIEVSNVLDRQGNLVNYAYVFLTEKPGPSSEWFQATICRVSVSPSGFPSVAPVHFGDLLVPLAYTGRTRELFTGLND